MCRKGVMLTAETLATFTAPVAARSPPPYLSKRHRYAGHSCCGMNYAQEVSPSQVAMLGGGDCRKYMQVVHAPRHRCSNSISVAQHSHLLRIA